MGRAVLVVARHPGQPARLGSYRDVLNRSLAGANVEPLVLAFRAVVAARMHRLLAADAATPPAELEPVVNA